VFANNGQGVRGDLQATVRAVLLDTEARTPNTSPSWGKLREPMVRLVQWARTFAVTSPLGLWNVGNTSSASTRLGQSPLRSPSVFNFFRPGYVPRTPRWAVPVCWRPISNHQRIHRGGLCQLDATVWPAGWVMSRRLHALAALATDPGALFDQFNLLLAAGQLGPAAVPSGERRHGHGRGQRRTSSTA
jgi:hypothetical protein